MKKNVAKKIEKKRGDKKVTCPQVPVFCYICIPLLHTGTQFVMS